MTEIGGQKDAGLRDGRTERRKDGATDVGVEPAVREEYAYNEERTRQDDG